MLYKIVDREAIIAIRERNLYTSLNRMDWQKANYLFVHNTNSGGMDLFEDVNMLLLVSRRGYYTWRDEFLPHVVLATEHMSIPVLYKYILSGCPV